METTDADEGLPINSNTAMNGVKMVFAGVILNDLATRRR